MIPNPSENPPEEVAYRLARGLVNARLERSADGDMDFGFPPVDAELVHVTEARKFRICHQGARELRVALSLVQILDEPVDAIPRLESRLVQHRRTPSSQGSEHLGHDPTIPPLALRESFRPLQQGADQL